MKKKLHIGCGKKYLDGHIHIDIYPFPHVDIVHDIARLSDLFDEGDIDEIYACHVFEHFNRSQVEDVLRDWHHVLRAGGTLRLAVPDFESVVEHYNEFHNLPQLMGLLYGGQTDPHNFHYVTFDYSTITKFLENTGFVNIQRYDAHAFLPSDFDDYSKAYLPHLDPNGRLMSLNIIATKS